jgi:hypothetical protein
MPQLRSVVPAVSVRQAIGTFGSSLKEMPAPGLGACEASPERLIAKTDVFLLDRIVASQCIRTDHGHQRHAR